MYVPLGIPSRKLMDLFLCTIGACVITMFTFPPQDPPPFFPIILPCWGNEREKQDDP